MMTLMSEVVRVDGLGKFGLNMTVEEVELVQNGDDQPFVLRLHLNKDVEFDIPLSEVALSQLRAEIHLPR